jgi:hypothetical protein
MGDIKSALELALERTADIQSDRTKLHEHEALQKGKRLASKFLHPEPDSEEEQVDLKEELKGVKKEDIKLVRQGVFDVILSNITLPHEEIKEDLLGRAAKGLEILLNNRKQIDYVFKQLKEFFSQYLQNKEQIRQNLEQQFAPRLRQKEEALKEKFGSSVELDPAADPEFAEYLKQNYAELDKQYLEALNQLKEQLKQMYASQR